MKKITALFLAIILICGLFLPVHKTSAATNLIANPSFETAAGAQPQSWQMGGWGTNTRALTYETNGLTGTRSVKTTVSNYTNGDAKWYFTPVSVTAGKVYTFSQAYKSSVASYLVAQYGTSTGSFTYQEIKTLPASATNWISTNVDMTIPAGATNVTVFHLIRSNGWLQIDDASLSEKTTTPPTAPSVSISTPTAGTTVSGTQVITANASDSSGTVAGVSFRIDGAQIGSEDTVAPYSFNWDTTTATNASHLLAAVARSTSGLSATSAPVSVIVNNVAPPTAPSVSISAPTAGTTVSGTQTISATASDASGTIVGVTFRVDGAQLGIEDTTAPYSVSWNTTTATNASHSLTAVARSTTGLSTTSASVAVTVSNVVTSPTGNLIPNPSVEDVDPSNNAKPNAWSSGNWGTNVPTYTYITNDGYTGTKSVRTTLSSISSGDAKWYFNPVNVTGSTTYNYGHFYKSSVATDIVAMFTDASGVTTYRWLATVAPNSAWQSYAAQITVPATTTKMSVLHVLYSVGWLQLDEATLTVGSTTPPPPPPTPSLIPNPSFETASATNAQMPANWSSNSWGTNTPTFQYMNEGRTGTKSGRVTISNYSSGDAKWFFDPQPLTPGQTYRFSSWYKTNTQPQTVLYIQHNNGSEQYIALPKPLVSTTAATTWQAYSDTFSVPATAARVSVFMYINANGWLQTDDYAITPYTPTGFNRPLVTMTFDDGFEQNVTTALPYMNNLGFKSTQCYATSFIQSQPEQIPNILAFRDSGHEICSHTVTHPFLTQLSATQVSNELLNSKSYLESITGVQIKNFATPYGDYNLTVKNRIMQIYQSHRTVDAGYNSKDNFDISRLRVQNMLSTTTLAEYQSWLNYAKATNTWLVLVYHKVDTTGVGSFDTYQSDFLQQLNALSQSGITVKTWQAALDELLPQL